MKNIVVCARPHRHLHIRESGRQIAIRTRMLDANSRLEKWRPRAIRSRHKKPGTALRRFLTEAHLGDAADFLRLMGARRRWNCDAHGTVLARHVCISFWPGFIERNPPSRVGNPP